MKHLKRHYLILLLNVVLITTHLFMSAGCGMASRTMFMKQLSNMSDQHLLCFYQGVNERIKEIGSTVKSKIRSDYTERDHFSAQEPFIFGGEAYKLNRKRLMILEELEKRNITPH